MLTDFFEDVTLVRAQSTPTGQGDTELTYSDVRKFRAGIYPAGSQETPVAAKNGIRSSFTVLHDKSIMLRQNELIRANNGRLYTITSNSVDNMTPACAGLQLCAVGAEVIA